MPAAATVVDSAIGFEYLGMLGAEHPTRPLQRLLRMMDIPATDSREDDSALAIVLDRPGVPLAMTAAKWNDRMSETANPRLSSDVTALSPSVDDVPHAGKSRGKFDYL